MAPWPLVSRTTVMIICDAGWTPQPIWTIFIREQFLSPTRTKPRFQSLSEIGCSKLQVKKCMINTKWKQLRVRQTMHILCVSSKACHCEYFPLYNLTWWIKPWLVFLSEGDSSALCIRYTHTHTHTHKSLQSSHTTYIFGRYKHWENIFCSSRTIVWFCFDIWNTKVMNPLNIYGTRHQLLSWWSH
jgi:hypothetical protein